MRAALYVRQSLDRYGESLAVTRQETECRDLANRRGWDVVGVYTDNDISASNGKVRPHYERLLADVSSGLVDAIVAWHPDRLHRRPIELERFVAIVDRHKVAVATCQAGELDLSTPSGRLVARQLGAVARYEVEHKGERQRAAARQQARDGLPYSGPRPFGYEEDRVTPRPLEAAAVAAAAQRVLTGGSLTAIAKSWNAAGHRTSRGNPWQGHSVRQLLLNPRYAGKRAVGRPVPPAPGQPDSATVRRRWETVGDAVWPALIDEATFTAVGSILADDRRRTTPGPGRRWLLTDLARCGLCGSPVKTNWRRKSEGGHRLYRCKAHPHLTRMADAVDEHVRQVIVRRLAKPSAAAAWERASQTAPTEMELRYDVGLLSSRREALGVDYAEGRLTAGQVQAATVRLDEMIAVVEQKLATSTGSPVLAALLTADDITGRFDALSLLHRRAVIDMLVTVTLLPVRGGRYISFDPASVQVEWRSPTR